LLEEIRLGDGKRGVRGIGAEGGRRVEGHHLILNMEGTSAKLPLLPGIWVLMPHFGPDHDLLGQFSGIEKPHRRPPSNIVANCPFAIIR
jgi:hypothetical protein